MFGQTSAGMIKSRKVTVAAGFPGILSLAGLHGWNNVPCFQPISSCFLCYLINVLTDSRRSDGRDYTKSIKARWFPVDLSDMLLFTCVSAFDGTVGDTFNASAELRYLPSRWPLARPQIHRLQGRRGPCCQQSLPAREETIYYNHGDNCTLIPPRHS